MKLSMKASVRLRFLLVQVITPHYHQDLAMNNMVELEQLVSTFGGQVIEKTVQHRVKPNPDMYIGKGKVEWLKETVKSKHIDVVVMNDLVNSGQLFRLEKTLWEVDRRIQVWDRVDLILNIFDQHATANEAKLQIELARIHHLGPRVYGLGGTVLSRQGGGIGTRGLGETNIEIEKRNIKKRKQQIQQQLKRAAKERENLINRRKKLGVSTVALVGYTSAGKTSLFNSLTRKDKQAHQSLFTTLESVVGRLKPDNPQKTLLVSDTIGFIENLPPFLVDAFRSTLQETVDAEILLHVIDAADKAHDRKIGIVDKILSDLCITKQPILVMNKIDLLSKESLQQIKEKYLDYEPVYISAKTGEGISELKDRVVATSEVINHL